MNKKISEDKSRLELVERLVKEGSIDFSEAIKLLEVEVEKEYISYPYYYPYKPYGYPYNPLTPYTGTGTLPQQILTNECKSNLLSLQ